PEHRYVAQSGLIGSNLPTHLTPFTAHAKEFRLAPGQDRLEVRLETAAADGVKVSKVIIFHRASYKIDITQEIRNDGRAPLDPQAYYQLIRDGKPPPGDPQMVRTFTGAAVYTEQEKFQKVSF